MEIKEFLALRKKVLLVAADHVDLSKAQAKFRSDFEDNHTILRTCGENIDHQLLKTLTEQIEAVLKL